MPGQNMNRGGACLSETVASLIKLLLENGFRFFSNCVCKKTYNWIYKLTTSNLVDVPSMCLTEHLVLYIRIAGHTGIWTGGNVLSKVNLSLQNVLWCLIWVVYERKKEQDIVWFLNREIVWFPAENKAQMNNLWLFTRFWLKTLHLLAFSYIFLFVQFIFCWKKITLSATCKQHPIATSKPSAHADCCKD